MTQYVYITGYNAGEVVKVDVTIEAIIGTVSATHARFITSDISGKFAYVDEASSDVVEKIDLATFAVVGSLSLGSSSTYGLALDPTGANLYVCDDVGGLIYWIDTASFTVLDTLSIGTDPRDITIDSSGSFAYVVDTGTTVYKIDLSSFSVVETSGAVISSATDIATEGAYVYVVDTLAGRIVRLDTATLGVVTNLHSSGALQHCAISGGYLYVTAESPDLLNQVDLSSFAVASSTPIGSGGADLYAIAIDPEGAFAYLPGTGLHNLWIVDLATLSVSAPFVIGEAGMYGITAPPTPTTNPMRLLL